MAQTEFLLEFEKPLRELERQLISLRESSSTSKVDAETEILAIEAKIAETKKELYTNLTPWQRIQLARHPRRPTSLDYIAALFTDFQELHGDRMFRDDPAFVGGPAFFDGEPIMVIGQQKGRDTKGNLRRNFGCPHPEGYRKAMRLMRMAEKFKMPIISLIDTPGAYPGIGAEERHVAEAIAVNIREMSILKVPTIGVIIGEGGSGGALGVGVTDRMLIFENAYYSVISPEGCAAILWKDRANAPQAAEALKLDARNLIEFGVADEVLAEPFGGAHSNHEAAAAALGKALRRHLGDLKKLSVDDLINARYDRYRKIGPFDEVPEDVADIAL
jgi:acetyl-CoA carboxylase carboxyl transferase subunit alpha